MPEKLIPIQALAFHSTHNMAQRKKTKLSVFRQASGCDGLPMSTLSIVFNLHISFELVEQIGYNLNSNTCQLLSG